MIITSLRIKYRQLLKFVALSKERVVLQFQVESVAR